MRKLLMLSLVALLVPVTSQAQFQLGLRAGYAPAMGDAMKDTKMKDFSLKSQIPLQLDALYKVNADIAVGAYFSYGFGQTDDALFATLFDGEQVCKLDGVDCSGSALRFGAQGIYTFNQVKAPFVPWAGLGLGYEMASTEVSGPGGKATIDLTGFEFSLQAGGDYTVNEKFAVGPYLQLSVGQYGSADIKLDGETVGSGSIDETGMHQWLSFGLRGKFDL